MYQLRDYQQETVDSVWGHLCNQAGNPLAVLPTGAGKSLVIAELARQAAEQNLPVLVLAHRKELLQQNAEKIQSLLPDLEVGIYSAGLKRRDTDQQILLAGIQSVHRRAFDLGIRQLVIVDEAHLIPAKESGTYRNFLADLTTSCPRHRVVGLTATPYRMDSGLIFGEDQIFSDVCHEVSVADLIDRGFLCPLVSSPVTEVDTSRLRHRGGEFARRDMELLFESHVISACEETLDVIRQEGRKKVLIFAAGVEHAHQIWECMDRLGEVPNIITGDTKPLLREAAIENFKNGQTRILINCDVLTTGFDAPAIDAIAVMRATESPGLFAQIAGRGLRLHPSKTDCLILDFGGNIKRHGPLDSDDYGKKSKKKRDDGTGVAPEKQCLACEEFVPAGVTVCQCGFKFPENEITHDATADTRSAILESQIAPQRWKVLETNYFLNERDKGEGVISRTMRVEYWCEPLEESEQGNLRRQPVREWVCLEHDGFARRKAEQWWSRRSQSPCPMTIEEGLQLADLGHLAEAETVTTKQDGKFKPVIAHELGPIPNPDELIGSSDASDLYEEAPF